MNGVYHIKEKENIMTDLSKFTNNEKRRAFFDERKEEDGWLLWFEEPRLNRKYMRCDVDGVTFICELREYESPYPKPHRAWRDSWYMVKSNDWEMPFENHSTNIGLCVEELRRLQKERKEKAAV